MKMYDLGDVNHVYMGGLVVKMLVCCDGSPRFDPQVENPKLSMDHHHQNPIWMSFR